MAGEVNRYAPGIMSLLDMKARGQLPRFLSDTVLGTLDLTFWMLEANVETRVGQVGPINSAAGWLDSSAPIQTQVPQDEIWYVHRVHCRATAALNGAGGAIVYRPLLRLSMNGRTLGIGDQSEFVWGNGDRPDVSCDKPFLMHGGDLLGIFVQRYTAFAVNPDIGVEALITRLRV